MSSHPSSSQPSAAVLKFMEADIPTPLNDVVAVLLACSLGVPCTGT